MRRHFPDEKTLKRHIRDHTDEIFPEVIEWYDNPKLPGEYYSDIEPDLMGEDADHNWVIVEVKLLGVDKTRSRYDAGREAVGQVLHYAAAAVSDAVKQDTATRGNPFREVDLKDEDFTDRLSSFRLFVVCERHSKPIENMCQLLRAFGINIEHLSVNPGENA